MCAHASRKPASTSLLILCENICKKDNETMWELDKDHLPAGGSGLLQVMFR